MFFGFGMFYSMVSIIFSLIFVMIFVIVIKRIIQWNKDNHAPRLKVFATVVSKRQNISRNGNHRYTHYYVTFELSEGDRIEFDIDGIDYGQLVEGDCGTLTYQGSRFLGFDREFNERY